MIPQRIGHYHRDKMGQMLGRKTAPFPCPNSDDKARRGKIGSRMKGESEALVTHSWKAE